MHKFKSKRKKSLEKLFNNLAVKNHSEEDEDSTDNGEMIFVYYKLKCASTDSLHECIYQ